MKHIHFIRLPVAPVTQQNCCDPRSTPDFIEPDMWPPNSPDLNPMDYAIWCVIQQRVWDQSWWHWWAAIVSAECVAWLGAVADWWRWPITCLCSCLWRTFWTYLVLVTISLFSLYLMNFMLHTTTTLDAAGNILRVHYKSTKWWFFIFTRQRGYLVEVDCTCFMSVKKFSSCLHQCKNYKNRTSFFQSCDLKIIYCRLFMNQCTYRFSDFDCY